MNHPTRTAREWFEEAARCYIESHQGCAWCQGINQVYRSERDGLLEYHCGSCEFYTSYHRPRNSHYMSPGNDRRRHAAPQTMLAIELG
jgi:hypothetical protein